MAFRDAYPKWICYGLWVVAEVAIAATDLAEVIGSATALYLLFGIPLWAGVLITAVDVLFILVLGMKNLRVLEFIVFVLIFLIFGIFVYELAVAHPNWVDVAKGFIPRARILTGAATAGILLLCQYLSRPALFHNNRVNRHGHVKLCGATHSLHCHAGCGAEPDILYTAIGIIGATVMPHNLYLHSSIIQSRRYPRTMKVYPPCPLFSQSIVMLRPACHRCDTPSAGQGSHMLP